MTLQMGIKAHQHGSGVWVTSLPPADVRRLGSATSSTGEVSVLGILNPEWRDGMVFFTPEDVIVLNEGVTTNAVLVQLTKPTPDIGKGVIARRAERMRGAARGRPLDPRRGDVAFLNECARLLPPSATAMADQLMKEVRAFSSGELVEGQARKWVNHPANFLAITIQNRDQSLAISIRGEPDAHMNTPIDLRRDRPGYSRFKVSQKDEISRAVALIRGAWRLYNESAHRSRRSG